MVELALAAVNLLSMKRPVGTVILISIVLTCCFDQKTCL